MTGVIYGDPGDLIEERDAALRSLKRFQESAGDMFMRFKTVEQAKRDYGLTEAQELDMWRSAAADISRLYLLQFSPPLVKGAS